MGTLEKEKKTVKNKKDVNGSLAKSVNMLTESRNFVNKNNSKENNELIRVTPEQKKFLEQAKQRYGRKSINQALDIIIQDHKYMEKLRVSLNCGYRESFRLITDNLPVSLFRKEWVALTEFQDNLREFLDPDDIQDITDLFLDKLRNNNGRHP